MYERIKALCKSREMSVTDLENELELGNATIRRWDHSSPKVSNIAKVAEYFRVSIDFLVYGKKAE